MHQSPRRFRSAAPGAALTVLAGLLFLASPLGQGLANLSFDLPFLWRPKSPVEGVIVIYMDKISTDKLGQQWGEARWDRKLHAQLLDRLKDCHAKAVVFDIRFDRTSANDQPFINALQAARQAGMPVIIGGEVNVDATAGGSVMTSLLRPIPELEKVSAWGLAEFGNDPLRRHFVGAENLPSLAMRTAELTSPQ